jgi:hypothetical protein
MLLVCYRTVSLSEVKQGRSLRTEHDRGAAKQGREKRRGAEAAAPNLAEADDELPLGLEDADEDGEHHGVAPEDAPQYLRGTRTRATAVSSARRGRPTMAGVVVMHLWKEGGVRRCRSGRSGRRRGR